MSSPLKQVGSRRLPPLSSASAVVRTKPNAQHKQNGKNANHESSHGPNQETMIEPDFVTAFMQGPFRTAFQDLSLPTTGSPPAKHTGIDPTAFLQGRINSNL